VLAVVVDSQELSATVVLEAVLLEQMGLSGAHIQLEQEELNLPEEPEVMARLGVSLAAATAPSVLEERAKAGPAAAAAAVVAITAAAADLFPAVAVVVVIYCPGPQISFTPRVINQGMDQPVLLIQRTALLYILTLCHIHVVMVTSSITLAQLAALLISQTMVLGVA
jgi:hypothetical protein